MEFYEYNTLTFLSYHKQISHVPFYSSKPILYLFSITISLLYGLSRYSADFLRRPLTHLSVPDLAFPGRTSPGTVRRQPGWKRRKHPRLQEQEG
ncbi:hypothetical protein Bca101_076155 [Brassica carinata]